MDQPFRANNLPGPVLKVRLNRDPLDLIKRDLIAGAIIELRGARAFVRRDGLRVLERPAVLEIGRDAGGAEGMAADPDAEADDRRRGAGSCARRRRGSSAFRSARRCGQRRSGRGGSCRHRDAGGLDVGIEVGFGLVVRRHLVALAAFLMQPDPPALALWSSSPRPAWRRPRSRGRKL